MWLQAVVGVASGAEDVSSESMVRTALPWLPAAHAASHPTGPPAGTGRTLGPESGTLAAWRPKRVAVPLRSLFKAADLASSGAAAPTPSTAVSASCSNRSRMHWRSGFRPRSLSRALALSLPLSLSLSRSRSLVPPPSLHHVSMHVYACILQVEIERIDAEEAARDARIPRAPLLGVGPIAEALATPLPPRPQPQRPSAAVHAYLADLAGFVDLTRSGSDAGGDAGGDAGSGDAGGGDGRVRPGWGGGWEVIVLSDSGEDEPPEPPESPEPPAPRAPPGPPEPRVPPEPRAPPPKRAKLASADAAATPADSPPPADACCPMCGPLHTRLWR